MSAEPEVEVAEDDERGVQRGEVADPLLESQAPVEVLDGLQVVAAPVVHAAQLVVRAAETGTSCWLRRISSDL